MSYDNKTAYYKPENVVREKMKPFSLGGGVSEIFIFCFFIFSFFLMHVFRNGCNDRPRKYYLCSCTTFERIKYTYNVMSDISLRRELTLFTHLYNLFIFFTRAHIHNIMIKPIEYLSFCLFFLN